MQTFLAQKPILDGKQCVFSPALFCKWKPAFFPDIKMNWDGNQVLPERDNSETPTNEKPFFSLIVFLFLQYFSPYLQFYSKAHLFIHLVFILAIFGKLDSSSNGVFLIDFFFLRERKVEVVIAKLLNTGSGIKG